MATESSAARPVSRLLVVALSVLVATAAQAQVAGDECTNAIPAFMGINGPVHTATMTPSANPPESGSCLYLSWNNSPDAWWVFNAPVTGFVTLEFCDSGFDTSVVLYEGSCGALTQIACDDDSCNPSGPGFQSKVVDVPVQGGPVYIRVGGYGGSTGEVQFNLTYRCPGITYAFGDNSFGQVNFAPEGGSNTTIAIASGYRHSLRIKSDGVLDCVGDNGSGQCTPPEDLGPISAVAAGMNHSAAICLSPTGRVRCWGANSFGVCDVPVDLPGATAIASGNDHMLAITVTGAVRGWGGNYYGESTTPADLGTATAIAAGWNHSMAIRASDRSVWCWGRNNYGQCTIPAGLGTAMAIGAGGMHSLAVRTDGSVRCWGNNANGQCDVPASLGKCVAVAGGLFHSVALNAAGQIRAWGWNTNGQTSVPSNLGFVTKIAAGAATTLCAAVRDCDGNHVFDVAEIASNDCNGTGVHDCWEIEAGTLEDCNGNLVGDACEKQLSVSLSSMTGRIGFGSPQAIEQPSAASAVSNVMLRLRGRGDFSSVLEYVRMRIGDLVDRQMLGGTGDCVQSPVWQELVLTPDEFNRGIGADGTWRASFTASSGVDAWLCPSATWLEMTLSYTGANSADCDANAELDSCQIAAGTVADTNHNGVIDTCESPLGSCPGDFNLDGTVDGADLGVLLGAWGPTSAGAAADLNGDGEVNGADLGILLGSWGPCAD